jgi:hypothetical protein
VTLGNPRIRQPGMHNRPLHLPWADVAEVVLFRQYAGLTSVPYVGLASARACGAPHHHLRPPQAPLAAQRGLVPHVPEPVLVRSRPVTGWHLDERRLLEAVTTFAPDVRVLHLDRDGSVRPLEVPADRQTPLFVATSQEPVGAVDVRLIGLNRPCILIETYREGALVAEAVYEQGGGHRDAGERRARYLARVHTEGRRLFTASEVLARPHWQRSTDSSGPAPNRSATRSPTMTCGSRRARPRTGSPWPRSTGGTSRRSRPSG